MTANPFADQKNPTTRKFLCCLHNRTDTDEGRRDGLMAIEVYDKMEEGQGLPYAEGFDRFWIIYNKNSNRENGSRTSWRNKQQLMREPECRRCHHQLYDVPFYMAWLNNT